MSAQTSPIERLQAAGKRITPERELLVHIIDRNPHLDATEIFRIAKSKRPQIGLATVYRTVKLLREIGMVRAIDLGEAHRHYEVKQDDHVHLVCSDCGRITDIPSPVSFRKLAGSRGFHVERIHLELIGICGDCAKKHAATERKGP